jgi:hypothetical protein
MTNTSTATWEIHKSLLRPSSLCCEQLGFESSPSGTGYQGGVILMQVHVNKSLEIDYYYTDIIILLGLKEKIIEVNSPPSQKSLDTLFFNLANGRSHDRIALTKKMFLRAKNPAGLLALIGLHNTMNTTIWRYHIQTMVSPCDENRLPAPYEKLKQHINEELMSITENTIINSTTACTRPPQTARVP